MTKTFTLLASAAMAIALTACASTDDKYSVGVDDNDRFASIVLKNAPLARFSGF